MRLSWKLLPVAALFALGVFLVSLPAGVVQAYNITVPATMALNTPTSITVGIDAGASRVIILSATSTTANSGLFVGTSSVSPTAEVVSGAGTTSLTFTENATSSARTLTTSFQCIQSASVNFFLFVNGVQQAVGTTTCGTGTGTGTATISTVSTLLAQGAQGSYTATANTTVAGQTITISGSPAFVSFGQPNIIYSSGFASGDTPQGVGTANLSIYTSQVGSRTITGTFTCIQQGTLVLTISVSGLTPAYSQSIICGTGLLTPTVGVASNITVAASPTSVSCNGTAFVTVTVRNSAGGYVADGTSVTLSASLGSLSPTTATTLGGGVLAVYTAPGSQSGTATIQASAAGAAQGSTSITVNCTSNTPTPAIPPTIFVPPSTSSGGGTGAIQPPNTGDAGLAGNDAWQTYAGIAAILISAIMAAAVVRARA